jgi:hypothetical protein
MLILCASVAAGFLSRYTVWRAWGYLENDAVTKCAVVEFVR